AVALAGVAAVLLLVVALRLEVRVEAHQFVVRWGKPPDVAPPPAAVVQTDPKAVRETAEKLQLVNDLIHALAGDGAGRAARRRGAVLCWKGGRERLRGGSERRGPAPEA